METRSIYIAPVSQREILAALVDLSSSGMLKPFGWVEVSDDPKTAGDALDPQLIWVEEGRLSVRTLGEISGSPRTSGIRMFLLAPLGLGKESVIDQEGESFYRGLIVFGNITPHYVRVLIPWKKEGETEVLGRVGWHNIMLSPEINASPQSPSIVWWSQPNLIPGVAAAALAAIGGITGAVEDAPLDCADHPGAQSIRVVKAFSRITDGNKIESELRKNVLDIGDNFPRPYRVKTSFPHPQAVCKATADEWAKVHEGVLRRKRRSIPDPPPTKVGFLQSLQWFFSFLWASIVGMPREWLARKSHQLKTFVAHKASKTLFGDGSAYTVIVGGVASDGKPANWEDVSTSAKNVIDALVTGDPTLAGRVEERDCSALWRDMLAAGQSLVDGSACDALKIEGGRGYVPKREDIAGETFTVQGGARTLFSDPVLPAWDNLALNDAQSILANAVTEGGNGGNAASTELQRLKEQRESNVNRYLPRISFHLADWFDKTRKEVRSYSQEINRLRDESTDDQLEREQSRLGKILRTITIVALILIVLFALLGLFDILAWATAGLVLGVTALTWMLGSLLVFIRLQRDVFQILHRREQNESRLADLKQHLKLSLQDLSAIGAAYQQYQLWASIFTAFLSNPLGEKPSPSEGSANDIHTPVNMQVRNVKPDDERLADVSAALRAKSFAQGWLQTAWEAVEEEVPTYLTAEQKYNWNEERALVWMDSGAPESFLWNWKKGIDDKGVVSERAKGIWSDCLTWLASEYSEDLALEVTTKQLSRSVNDYQRELRKPSRGQVILEVLTSAGRVAGAQSITGDWFCEVEEGLSSTMVLVQSTNPISPAHFVYTAAEAVHDFTEDAEEF